MADQTADRVVVELEARTTNYLSRMRAARRDYDGYMESMGKSAERMERRTTAAGDRMASGLRAAIAAIAVGAAVKEAQQLADAWTQTGNKLAAAGVATSDLAGRQGQLVQLALDTRTAYSQTADIYARITRSTKELNTTDAQRLRLTELINKSVKAGGATTAEQISTITQLGQALASGNLQGDELRSIRENAPLLARALAEEFGTTVGGLKKLGAEGEITSDRIVKAILKAGGSIDESFGRTRSTIGETFTALETRATQFIGNFDKALGVTAGITAFTQSITEDFDTMAQAVIVAAAVAGGAIIGKLSVPLQQAAVSNVQFVRSLFAGTTALQLQGREYRNVAIAASVKAQAERDGARAAVIATQARINELRQEAVQYQQNIALANAQRAAVAQQATGRDSGGRFVSSGETAQAAAARNAATKARIASSMQLKRVEDELILTEQRLTAQNAALSTSLVRVAAASSGVSAAIARTSLLANAGTIAMRGLGVAMSFFGGPIGLAIMAVAGAVAYFATEAAKAEAAAGNLRSTLDETEQQADETRQRTDQLASSQKDGARASGEAASKARDSSSAYDQVAKSAADAAEMVKYLTAAQRQQRLEKLDEQISDVRKARSGNNPFTTNGRENIANLREQFVREAFGNNAARSDRYDRTGGTLYAQRAATMATAPNADPKLNEAYQKYVLAVNAFNEGGVELQRAVEERRVILANANAPTLERPEPTTSNLTAPTTPTEDSDNKGGGRGKKEETQAELEARREIFELEQRLALQRAAGAESLAQFTQDELDRRRIIKDLEDQKFTPAEAEAAATEYITELRAAREVAAQRERDDEARKKADEYREDAAEKAKERQAQINFLQEQDLLLQRELANLAGDSERVKELDKILDRMQRIQALVSQGGMTPEQAAQRATGDQEKLDNAETAGDIKDIVFTPIKDALLEAFKGGDWSDAFGDAIEQKAAEGLESALNTVYDLLSNTVSNMFKNAVGGSGGGKGIDFGSLIKSAGSFFGFGGGRAGGGLMKPGMVYNFEENGRERIMVGSTARVLPNRVESASAGGGSTNIGISVINATGVAAKASVEQDSDGNATVRLEPLIDQSIQSAGRRGVLDSAARKTPRAGRRG